MRRKLYFTFVLTYIVVSALCGRSIGSNVTLHCNINLKKVRTLLEQRKPIAVSRAFYSNNDYPICVRSRFEMFTLSGYMHKLSYFEQQPRGSGRRGRRHSLRAFIEVELKQVASLRITGYLARGFEDPRVSGLFDILYAANACFIVGTKKEENTQEWGNSTRLIPKASSQCVLWRLARVSQRQRDLCRQAFRRHCRGYRGHKFVYTKEKCSSNNNE
ncbi:uncharacterized protein LOC119179128 isoform X1 [Rhipicephalus microplus]|uniref:uncharacterized protein LOC119179128 isoform X1 n=1 Tax=Rhipicephalus microplus TaxID=6941 RepID=UPI003F6A8F8A